MPVVHHIVDDIDAANERHAQIDRTDFSMVTRKTGGAKQVWIENAVSNARFRPGIE